jgi:FixJ family two-component response regulator
MPAIRDAVMIYIVEDDASVRRGLSRLMRAAGFEVRAFGSAERFLDEVDQEQRACVLLDMTMPRLTGVQVQERLRERKIQLPVIAVSARDDEEIRRAARALGAQFFFRKPVDDQALLDAIAWATGSGGGPA